MRVLRSGHRLIPVSYLVVLCAAAPAVAAQIPTEFRNLRVVPKDISRDSLLLLMRSFSFATGLRCEGCHVLGPNDSFEGARFDLDDRQNKRKARVMLEMVNTINEELLARLPERDSPPLAVECKTCHRGAARPHLLRTELRQIVLDEGIEAAVARYRLLREQGTLLGRYDFGEWEMNELARQLAAEGNTAAAVAMLELNEEFHARSASIPAELGPLLERLGRTDQAIAAYRRALERNPDHRASRERLQALTGGTTVR